MNLAARTIPVKYRGQMIGNAQMLAGLLSIAAGFLIKMILTSALETDVKYSVILGRPPDLTLNTFFYVYSRPGTKPAKVQKQGSFRNYITFCSIWKSNVRIRRVVIARAIYSLSLMAATLIVLFGSTALK